MTFRILLIGLNLFIQSWVLLSCSEKKAPSEHSHQPSKKPINPALQAAIDIREKSIQTSMHSIFLGKPLDEEAIIQMWQNTDPVAKRSQLKLWTYLTAMQSGFTEKEAREEASLPLENEKATKTWDEFAEWNVDEYAKTIKQARKKIVTPKTEDQYNSKFSNIFKSEGPYTVKNRAYVFTKIIPDLKNNIYSIIQSRHDIFVDEYREQQDGTWARVDWKTWGKMTRYGDWVILQLPTELDHSHISDDDFKSYDPSLKQAVDSWKTIIESPEKIDPYTFVDHCDPAMLKNCKQWLKESLKYGKLNEYGFSAGHLFTWSSLYESDLKKITPRRFWLAYLRYCRDHMQGKFYDPNEQLDNLSSGILNEIFPERKTYTAYERYLLRGSNDNCFIERLFYPRVIHIHDLVPINDDTIYLIYRTTVKGGILGGISKEKFVRVAGKWKFQDTDIRHFFEFPALRERFRHEINQEKEIDN